MMQKIRLQQPNNLYVNFEQGLFFIIFLKSELCHCDIFSIFQWLGQILGQPSCLVNFLMALHTSASSMSCFLSSVVTSKSSWGVSWLRTSLKCSIRRTDWSSSVVNMTPSLFFIGIFELLHNPDSALAFLHRLRSSFFCSCFCFHSYVIQPFPFIFSSFSWHLCLAEA